MTKIKTLTLPGTFLFLCIGDLKASWKEVEEFENLFF